MYSQTNAHAASGKIPPLLGQSLQLGLSFFAAALTAALLSLFWGHLGLPDHPLEGAMASAARPQGLKLFVAAAPALALLLPSLALALLKAMLPSALQANLQDQSRRLFTLDALSYLVCPLLLIFPLLWGELGNGFAALGLLYLGLVACRAYLLLSLLWLGFLAPAARQAHAGPLRPGLAVFLVAWLILGLLAAWHHQAISSASDEVGYLLLTHSLVSQGGFNVFPALEAKEYLPFYWARFSPGLAQSYETAQAWLYPFLLAPAYWLGGRLGVLLMNAGLMALLAGQLLAWLEKLRIPPAPAAWATGLLLMSAPLFFLGQQAYPDVPAMLLVVVGLRLLGGLDQRPWLAGGGLAATALLLPLIKLRLAPLGAGLLLAGGLQLMARRWGWSRAWLGLAGLSLLLGLAAWLTPAALWPGFLRTQAELASYHLSQAQHWWQPLAIFILGLLLDQNFGLLPAAPLLLLALAGLPAALRDHPRACLGLLAPALLYLGAMCLTRWFQWYAGFSVPGRFAALLLPAAAPALAMALFALRQPWWRLISLLLALASLAYASLGCLIPSLRYSRPVGYNPLLAALGGNLNLEMHQLLPSTFILSPTLYWWLGVALAAGLGLAWLVWRRSRPPAPPAASDPLPAWPPPADLLALPLLACLGLAALLAAAVIWPPRFLEAEHMQPRDGAVLWTEYAYPRTMRGMVLLDGQGAQGSLNLPGGPVRLTLVGWHDVEQDPRRVTVRLAGLTLSADWPFNQRTLELPAPGQPPLDLPAGPQQVTVSWRACSGRDCNLILDRLEARPAR